YENVAAAAEQMTLPANPQPGRNKARSQTAVGGAEIGFGVYDGSSSYCLAGGAKGKYGSKGNDLCDYTHDASSRVRPDNIIRDGGYGFDFLPVPPPAPKRTRGPPPLPPEYDTFEAQWQVTEAAFGRCGPARDGSACRFDDIRALMSEW
ncbi:hypothetical protein Vretifemale_6500, partial [Volvox reticuliferus]